MGLFRPYERNDASAAAQVTVEPATSGKGAPTPSRRQAEAQRRQRLHPTLTKRERRARKRNLARAKQDEAYNRMEMRPERVLLRNFIDSRWTLSEFAMPTLMILMAATLAGRWTPWIAYAGMYGMYGVLALVIIEVAWLWYRFKAVLADRLPGTPRRGLLMYLASRASWIRAARRPPAIVKRGARY